jgi:hypothetical protein
VYVLSFEVIPIDTDVEKDEMITFDLINEKWHTYELEDNTIIKTKFILLNIIAYGEKDDLDKRLTGFATQLLVVVYSPKELRGPKDKTRRADELEEYITEKNLKFRKIIDGGMSKYDTEKSNIQIDHSITQVDMTSKYDSSGMPAYIVRSKNNVIIAEKIQEINP